MTGEGHGVAAGVKPGTEEEEASPHTLGEAAARLAQYTSEQEAGELLFTHASTAPAAATAGAGRHS